MGIPRVAAIGWGIPTPNRASSAVAAAPPHAAVAAFTAHMEASSTAVCAKATRRLTSPSGDVAFRTETMDHHGDRRSMNHCKRFANKLTNR
jgi:hypothetical protein